MASGDTPKRELLNIKPAEVSLVDAAANEEEFLIVKRKETQEQDSSMATFDLEIKKGVLIDALARERADDFAEAAAKLVQIANDSSSTKEDVWRQFDLIWSMLYETENDLLKLAESNGIDTPSQMFIAKMTEKIDEALSALGDYDTHLVVKEKLAAILTVISDGKPIVIKETVEIEKSSSVDDTLAHMTTFLDDASTIEETVEKAKKITPARIQALQTIVEKSSALLADFTSSTGEDIEKAEQSAEPDETINKETQVDTQIKKEDDEAEVVITETAEATSTETAEASVEETAEEVVETEEVAESTDDVTEAETPSVEEVAKSSNDELLANIATMFSSKFEEVEKKLSEKIDAKMSSVTSEIQAVAKRQETVEDKITTRGVSKSASEDETSTEEIAKNESIWANSVFTPAR